MRILYCNKYNFAFSGTEVYLFEVMDLMRAGGHEVALFSMADARGRPTPYDQHFVPHTDFKNGNQGLVHRVRLAAHAIYSREARTRVRGMIAAFRPDVAHVRNIYHHLSPSILWELKARGIPVVYHLNDFKLLCPNYNFVAKGQICQRCRGHQFWRVMTECCHSGVPGSTLVLAAEAYFHRWLRTYQKCVDLFLAPSRFVKHKLVENGWEAEKIMVLPHFQRLPEQMPTVPAGDAPVLYFGRLSPEKGLIDLLRAMQRTSGIRLKLAGEGPQRRQLESLTRELRLTNVEFLGQVTGAELDQVIASARFTVLPSRAYETLGKSILESYAQARPVVASDLGSRRELVDEGKTGLLFRPGDVEQLAAAISFLAERPQLAATMGSAGRELVRERHSPEGHYLALTHLYEQLTSAARRRPHSKTVQSTQPRLRVAFIGGRGVISKYSGIEAYYEEAGKHLADLGHEITLYCRTYFTPPGEEHHGMRLVRLPTIRTKHLETLVHTFLSTMHAAFHRYDIVHYHCLGPALFSFIPRLFGKKTVVTVQGLDWQRKKWGRFASLVLRWGERAAVRLPNATMVVSQTLQEYYRALYGAETIYVPNGTSSREWRPPSQILQWGLERDQYILFLGRFSPEKNCHLLLEAYEKLDTPVKLVLAGGSSHTEAYAQQLRLHQSSRILLLEWVRGDALEELLTNAMLFVLPSDLEGLSLALLDAMSAGVCVLASDTPENCEVVEGVGFTFQRGDKTDLERMLRLLLSDPQLRKLAGESARSRVGERYLWPQVVNQIAQVYQGLVGPERVREAAARQQLPAKTQAQPRDHAA